MNKSHFEKRTGAYTYYRQIETRGSRMMMTFGRAADVPITVAVTCLSAKKASETARFWSARLEAEGFRRFEFPDGIPGIVSWFESAQGPGRVAADGGNNVSFLRGSVECPGLKVGQRVLVHGIRRNSKLGGDFTLGGKLQATRLTAFPAPDRKINPVVDRTTDELRTLLIKLSGSEIRGDHSGKRKLGAVSFGDLLFTYEAGIYEAGIHRFIRQVPGSRDPVLIDYEPIFTANFKRRSGAISTCAISFCAHIPSTLKDQLAAIGA